MHRIEIKNDRLVCGTKSSPRLGTASPSTNANCAKWSASLWRAVLISKTCGLVIALSAMAVLVGIASAEPLPAGATTDLEPRQTLNFNTHWFYMPGDMFWGGQGPLWFDEQENGFEPVCLPHANNVLKFHKNPFRIKNPLSGGFSVRDYRFASWYRRRFQLPEECRNKRVIVEFEGVATVAEVYVNSQKPQANLVGVHKGAYTGFAFDITDYVTFDGTDNVIAVRVDSQRRPDIPPEGQNVDYCLFGGIVRDVRMIIVDPLHVEWLFAAAPKVTPKRADLEIQTRVTNKHKQDKAFVIQSKIMDAENRTVAEVESTHRLPAGASEEFRQRVNVDKPHLWDVDDPYLYTVEVTIREGQSTVDRYASRTGFRSIRFSKEDGGFYLNDRKIKIRGLNRHEQWPWIGRAAPDRLQRQDADTLKHTLGVNLVRCSHYPQDPAFLDRCDEIGLLVLEEVPGWQHVGPEAWQALLKTNLEELIIRDRNHPSVVSWGVRVNESSDVPKFNAAMNKLAKRLDPTRPTHGVRHADRAGTDFREDIYTINYTIPETKPPFLPWLVTEHSGMWDRGFPWATDQDHVKFLESFADPLDRIYANPAICGGIGWSYADYNTEDDYTLKGQVFYSGVLDLFRLPKFAAYFYASQKDPVKDQPMVFIANYWTAKSPTEVTVASNCEEVELFLNGKSQGRCKPNTYMHLPHPLFVFPKIAFEAGELKAEGRLGGAVAATHVRRTPGAVARLSLVPDFDRLVADGSDLTQVTVTALDADGNRVPAADNEIRISVMGSGTFLGENPVRLEGGRMVFLVQTKLNTTGTILCEAQADGLQSGTTAIEVTTFQAEIVPLPARRKHDPAK
ncbi:MAG: DUF4982 domain-containing protein [Lentisphaerae bacterium]|nr:DUF4982 domain-containing protein [Lentisphaerota bacterium]